MKTLPLKEKNHSTIVRCNCNPSYFISLFCKSGNQILVVNEIYCYPSLFILLGIHLAGFYLENNPISNSPHMALSATICCQKKKT